MIYEELVKAKNSGQSVVLCTVVEALGSAPRAAGSQMLLQADGSLTGTIGGGAVEKAVLEEAKAMLGSNATKLVKYDLGNDLLMSCGGKMSIFIQAMAPESTLIIFGAGHIGHALLQIGKMLQFRVILVDNRPEFANPERCPSADQILAQDYSSALPQIPFSADSYIVLVTHRHVHDQEILEYCVQQPFKYLGMIGSRNKVNESFKKLREKGIPDEKISQIHSPIGLDIGAQTPEEIAVAIAAEMIGVRAGVKVPAMKMEWNK